MEQTLAIAIGIVFIVIVGAVLVLEQWSRKGVR